MFWWLSTKSQQQQHHLKGNFCLVLPIHRTRKNKWIRFFLFSRFFFLGSWYHLVTLVSYLEITMLNLYMIFSLSLLLSLAVGFFLNFQMQGKSFKLFEEWQRKSKKKDTNNQINWTKHVTLIWFNHTEVV